VAAAPPWRAWLGFALLTIIVAGVFYASALAWLYFKQDDYIYYPDAAPQAIGPAGPPIQVLSFTTPDGETLEGWYLPPRDGRPVFLFFNGNAMGLAAQNDRWRRLAAHGDGFLSVGYRGYGASTGKPREKALHADAALAYDWLATRYPADRIVINGYSLGSGVAVRLAAERPARALILEAPYTSTVAVAREQISWAPLGLLMHERFESDRWIGQVKSPILIVHGDHDQIIAYHFGEELYALAPQPKRFVRMMGSQHHTLVRDGVLDRIWEFLGEPAQAN
jgi:fermentation-respiration switch protein FrsA (DUF1100 family)